MVEVEVVLWLPLLVGTVACLVALFKVGRWSLLAAGVLLSLIGAAGLIVYAAIGLLGGSRAGDYMLKGFARGFGMLAALMLLPLGLFMILLARDRIYRRRIHTEGFINTDFELNNRDRTNECTGRDHHEHRPGDNSVDNSVEDR